MWSQSVADRRRWGTEHWTDAEPCPLADLISYGLLCVGVFAGAFVSGLAGFAFSAVAGAILLHVRPPTEAVPLMMACSMVVQGASLVALRNSISWQGSLALV